MEKFNSSSQIQTVSVHHMSKSPPANFPQSVNPAPPPASAKAQLYLVTRYIWSVKCIAAICASPVEVRTAATSAHRSFQRPTISVRVCAPAVTFSAFLI